MPKEKILSAEEQNRNSEVVEEIEVENWSIGKVCPFLSTPDKRLECIAEDCALYGTIEVVRAVLDDEGNTIKDDNGQLKLKKVRVNGCSITLNLQQGSEMNQILSYDSQINTFVANRLSQMVPVTRGQKESGLIIPVGAQAGI